MMIDTPQELKIGKTSMMVAGEVHLDCSAYWQELLILIQLDSCRPLLRVSHCV